MKFFIYCSIVLLAAGLLMFSVTAEDPFLSKGIPSIIIIAMLVVLKRTTGEAYELVQRKTDSDSNEA